ncbi:MAG: hypothetical protein Q9224_006691 [Gallowayella concinna]
MDDQPTKTSHDSRSAEFWSNLGLQYERAFSNDPKLVSAVQRWLSHLPPVSHVLECGCGTGVPIACTIANGGHHYYGIDIAAGMIALCQQRVPEGSFQVVNMLSYKPPRLFEGVVASLSFFELSYEEHVSMARNWFEWLRPGGYCLVCTITDGEPVAMDGGYGDKSQSAFDWETGCTGGLKASFMGYNFLCTMFTQRGWVRLLQGAGFEIVDVETDLFVSNSQPDEPRLYVIAKRPEGMRSA